MRKFEVYIDGKAVELEPEKGFDLVLKNPMLFYESVPGAKASGIELKNTSKNRAILGNLSDPMSLTSLGLTQGKFFCQQVLDGNLIEEGWASPQTPEGGFKLEFSSNLNDFFTGIQQELVSSLDFGTIGVPVDWDTIIGNTWDVGGFVAPMLKNTVFYKQNAPGGWDGILNKYTGGTYVAADNVPMFFLKRILDDLAGIAGISISGGFWESGLLESLLIYNSRIAEGVQIETRLHLPDLSVGQLFMNIRKFLNVIMWFDGIGGKIKMEDQQVVWEKPCEMNWSSKAGPSSTLGMTNRITGYPLGISGARLSSTVDSGRDGLSKDSFFDPYLEGSMDSAFGVESAFSSMPIDDVASASLGVTIPAIEAAGITDEQPDEVFPAKLIASTGSATATNGYGDTVFRWAGNDGLAKKRFERDIEFWRNTFRVTARVALNAADLAKVSRIFKGQDSTAPFVHLYGVNYVIEELKVPSDSSICEVSLLRL